MYERTIAGEHRIYEVTLSGTSTKIKDLLSPTDLADYDYLVEEFHPRKHIVVDGYILCNTSQMFISTSESGVEETVDIGIQFTCPVGFWLDKTWVRGSGNALIRVFFS